MQNKHEFQDGGTPTENTYIPDWLQQSCKIPTATFIFSRWINSLKPFPILCKANRSPKSKTAAHKQGKLISQLVYNVAALFHRLQTCILRLKHSVEQFTSLCNASEWTYISACIQHSCAIPTAVPSSCCSRSRNSKKLFFIMCDASGRIEIERERKDRECESPSWISDLACITQCKNSFIEFFALENMGVAVGIKHLRCIQAEE